MLLFLLLLKVITADTEAQNITKPHSGNGNSDNDASQQQKQPKFLQDIAVCSIKPGTLASAKMPRAECDILIQIFHDREGEIQFVSDEDNDEFGFCIDVACLNARLAERLERQKARKLAQTEAKAKKMNKSIASKGDVKAKIEVDEREHRAEHKFEGPKREPTMAYATNPNQPAPTNPTPTPVKAARTPFQTPLQTSPNVISSIWDSMNNIFSLGRSKVGEQDDRVDIVHNSQCSLSDRANQNACCTAGDDSPCCDYNQRIRRVFGIARFGIGRFGRPRNLPEKRIVGGTPAGSLKTSVVYISKHSFEHQFCGGVIVHPNWILTAAHCLRDYCGMQGPNDLVIKVGKTTKDNHYYDMDEQIYNAIAIHCHERNCKSDGNPRVNDIALVRLNQPIAMGSAVDVAQMPKQYDDPILSKDCIMLGWGDTKGTGFSDILKQVQIPLVSNEQCNDHRWRSCGVRSCMLCAGRENASPCSGDSGGPLFCPWHSNLYQLHGIYSYGRCGADRTKPAVFTRVSNYVDWIEITLNRYNDFIR